MMNAKKPMSATVTATMAAIRAAPKDRMNWMTSCTFALTRAHSHWARFARFMEPAWFIMIEARERLLAILLNARGAQTGQTMLVDRVLPRQELFNRERVAGAGFLKREETTANRCDHFGLTPNDPAFRSRCRQVRNRQRAAVGTDHI